MDKKEINEQEKFIGDDAFAFFGCLTLLTMVGAITEGFSFLWVLLPAAIALCLAWYSVECDIKRNYKSR